MASQKSENGENLFLGAVIFVRSTPGDSYYDFKSESAGKASSYLFLMHSYRLRQEA